MAVETVELEAISVGARRFVLKTPITVEIFKDGPIWRYEYAPLGITVSSFNKEAAVKQFRQEFQSLWDEYSVAEESGLGATGRYLRKKLLSLVDRLE